MADENPAAGPKWRQFGADYKLAVVEEYEQVSDKEAKGALLPSRGCPVEGGSLSWRSPA